MKNKKGSISISINMIVVVVLAFVMLGLMLGVGRNIMQQADSGAISIMGQTKAEIENQLIRSNEPLYFSSRQYDVEFGKMATLNFGVKNTEPSSQELVVRIQYIDPESDSAPVDLSPNRVADADTGGSFFWVNLPDEYGPGMGKANDIQYRAPNSRGTHTFKFILEDASGSQKASQIIFINVI